MVLNTLANRRPLTSFRNDISQEDRRCNPQGQSQEPRYLHKTTISKEYCSKCRLRYFGHIVRMDPTRYPKVAKEGYVHRQRGRGKPKKRWMDMIEQDCEMLGLNIYNAGKLAQDRAGWKNAVEELSMRTNVSPRH